MRGSGPSSSSLHAWGEVGRASRALRERAWYEKGRRGHARLARWSRQPTTAGAQGMLCGTCVRALQLPRLHLIPSSSASS